MKIPEDLFGEGLAWFVVQRSEVMKVRRSLAV